MARRVRLGLSFGAAAKVLRSGFGIFTSQVWAAVLASSNVFVLGLFASNKQVGTYAVAEKIVKAAICMGIPLCSSVYPRSGILFRQAADAAYVFLRKFLALGGMIMAAVSVLLFALAPVVVFVVVGRMAPDIAVLVRILAVLPLSVFIDNIYGSQVLLNTGHEKKVVYAVAISALSAIISLVSLVPLLGPLGAAYSYLFSELLVLALMGVFLWRAGVSPLLRVRQAKHGDG
jgi:PST family polysaccharide transporter